MDIFYLIIFILRLLSLSGFYFLEKKCVCCGKKDFSYFSLNTKNEVVCIDCSMNNEELFPVYILDYIKKLTRRDFLKYSLFKGKNETLKFLIKYIENIVGFQVKAYYIWEKR